MDPLVTCKRRRAEHLMDLEEPKLNVFVENFLRIYSKAADAAIVRQKEREMTQSLHGTILEAHSTIQRTYANRTVIGRDCQVNDSMKENKGTIVNMTYQRRSPDRIFIGRNHEMEEINENLLQGRLVIVIGPRGVGKSELASKYAYDNYSTYQCILFLNASTATTLENSAKGLLSHLTNVDRYASDITLNSLMGRAYVMLANEKVLFIIDDAPDYESIEMLLPYSRIASENHHFIVTSSSKASEWCSNRKRTLHITPLKEFTQAEAILYVKTMLAIADESEDEILKDLANAMSCLPGDLQEAVAWIISDTKETKGSVENSIVAYMKATMIQNGKTYSPFRHVMVMLNASCTVL